MYQLPNEIKESIDKTIKSELGMSYRDFDSLDFDEQQKLLEQNRNKKADNSEYVTVMIGSGENAFFTYIKCGEKYMLDDGTFVTAGDTPENSRERLDDIFNNLTDSKSVSFAKKLKKENN